MISLQDDHNRGYINVSFKGGSTWEVHDLYVQPEHRGKGVGRALLKAVCRQADEEGVTLELVAGSGGLMTNEQLEAWYGRNGFAPSSRNNYWLRRTPQATSVCGIDAPYLSDYEGVTPA